MTVVAGTSVASPTFAPAVAPAKAPVAAARPPTRAAKVGGVAPADPYAPDLANEVELTATRSAGEFARCHQDTSLAGDVHIEFMVQPDGHTAHVHAATNSTGSPKIAACLSQVIARWTFAVHPTEPTHFVRPFSYAASAP
jgi:hypothetical protein